MKDLMSLMKQAGQIQARMKEMQESLAAEEVDGQSGGGMVKVTLNGKGELKRVAIDPTLLKPEDVEMLEDLIVAAANDARAKVETKMQEMMQEVAGGLPLPPGMKLF